jgi:hypothetical protein
MRTAIFLDKDTKPGEAELSEKLGKTYDLWNRIKAGAEAEFGGLTEEWKFYSKSSGWTMKLMLKKRNLLFFNPREGSFFITFVFGEKAVNEIEKSNLPQKIKDDLSKAQKYAEGRGLNIEISRPKDAEIIGELIKIKIKN